MDTTSDQTDTGSPQPLNHLRRPNRKKKNKQLQPLPIQLPPPPTTNLDPFNLDELTDFFQDLEGDDTPTYPSASFVPATIIPVTASSYRH
jgi:uncharacterized protein YecE (DUF72 family)